MSYWKNAAFILLAIAPGVSLGANLEGEEIPAHESQAIQEVTQMVLEQVQKAAETSGHAFRDAHRKHHGCVQARFAVTGEAPASLRQGLFAEVAEYPAWIRYSNGSGQAQDDHQGDGRGMAVKVLGVAGARNLSEADDEATSQDFLMINHEVFFVRNAQDYVGFQKAVASGNLLWWILNPKRIFHEGRIAKAIQGKLMVNPLEASYFSMTASKLGNTQMKFRAIPCPGAQFRNPSDSSDRLRENLQDTLTTSDACFLFQVQERLNPRKMSIEDPTLSWSEKDSPFKTVAKISIPAQAAAQGVECEALSFNPWNGLAAHRPLGGISRVRKAVYQAISRFRHDFNQQVRSEPSR